MVPLWFMHGVVYAHDGPEERLGLTPDIPSLTAARMARAS